METINIFVYGTLMSGFGNSRLIPEDSVIRKGQVIGKLYHLSAGFPALELPKYRKPMIGSLSVARDIKVQHHFSKPDPERFDSLADLCIGKGYVRVTGELITLLNPSQSLPPIDGLEGFHPDSEWAMYQRTLVPVRTDDGCELAWVYNMPNFSREGTPVVDGDWREFKKTVPVRSFSLEDFYSRYERPVVSERRRLGDVRPLYRAPSE